MSGHVGTFSTPLYCNSLVLYWFAAASDVKFHNIFRREIFHEIFPKYFKNFKMDYGCRLYSSL